MFTLTTVDAPELELPLRQFSADEYMAMTAAGVFDERKRVELIGGYVVDMSPANADHNYIVMRLNELFMPLAGRFRLWIQGTLAVDRRHVYDPDFMLLRLRTPSYKAALPTPADVALVVEVAGTSLDRDARVKLPVYAAAGIAEYWIADVQREVLIVHRHCQGQTYGEIRELAGDEQIAPLAAPELLVTVRELFD